MADVSCHEADCGDDMCDGNDWIELFNGGEGLAHLENFTLSDEHGRGGPHAYHFPDESFRQGRLFTSHVRARLIPSAT